MKLLSLFAILVTFAIVHAEMDFCENGGIPPTCCSNGLPPPCCGNGSNSPYCCANNSFREDCDPSGIPNGAEGYGSPSSSYTNIAPVYGNTASAYGKTNYGNNAQVYQKTAPNYGNNAAQSYGSTQQSLSVLPLRTPRPPDSSGVENNYDDNDPDSNNIFLLRRIGTD